MHRLRAKWARLGGALAMALAVCCYLGIRFWWYDGREGPAPGRAPVVSNPAKIVVGRNIHVSDAYIPAIAVNKDRVVGVTWYDRRGLPTVLGLRAPFYPPGCNMRIRVSLDGGETWQPSVRVNEKTIQSSVWELRDTAG